MNLKPCLYRHVNDEGLILCDRIKTGDRAVSPNICRACPISAINCANLRATLEHSARPPITVRYGNGRTEIWDDVAPAISLERAACSAKVIPITSPRDCAGCPLRRPMAVTEVIGAGADAMREPQTASRRAPPPAVKRVPMPAPALAQQPQAIDDEPRKSLVAQKIIQLQEWLTKQKAAPRAEIAQAEEDLPVAVGAGRGATPRRTEEKRVGWTD